MEDLVTIGNSFSIYTRKKTCFMFDLKVDMQSTNRKWRQQKSCSRNHWQKSCSRNHWI